MIRRRRMIRCWPMSGSAGCPAGRSVTAACPASGLTGPTCASSATCGRKPRTGWRTSAVSVASRTPSTAPTCTMNCWHPGCTGMRSPVTAFRSRAPSAGCRANPTGDGDLAASQLTVTPTVPRSPYAGSQDAHHLGQPLTQPIVFPGGQIHRVAGPNPAGLREAAYSDAPPLYASEGAKRTEHPRVCTLPPA